MNSSSVVSASTSAARRLRRLSTVVSSRVASTRTMASSSVSLSSANISSSSGGGSYIPTTLAKGSPASTSIPFCCQRRFMGSGGGSRGARGHGWWVNYRAGKGGRHLQGTYSHLDLESMAEWNDAVLGMGRKLAYLDVRVEALADDNNNDNSSDNNNNNNNNTNGNDFSPTSRESTTDYMLWSLLTTLVWVAEISLRAAFPKIDTVLVVFNHDEEHLPDDDEAPLQSCSADGTRNEDSHEDGMPGARPLFLHSATAETRSVVTIERVVQKRSLKQRVVIVTELLLAVFFGIETVGDCWNFWHSRRSSSRIGDTDDYVYREDDQYYDHDYYDYDYDDNDDDEGGKFYQQQADVWVSVLAYAYMTYETYHAYRRSTTTQREIERSLSTVSQSQQRPSQRQQRGRDATVTAATTVATTATATTPPLEVMVHGIRPQDPASASASTSTSSALSLDPKHKAGKDIEPMVTACLAESCSDVTPDENDGNSSNNSSNNNNNNNDNNNDNGKA